MRKFVHQNGPLASLSQLQRIQAHFGLTQQELADVLGISRSALNMSGRGQRHLSPEVWARILLFQQALPVAEPGAEPTPEPAPPLSEDDRQELDLCRRELELQADLLGGQLARRRTRLAQARLRLRTLPGLRAAFPADDEVAQALLKVWQNEANATLRKEAGPLARLALRQAVTAFEAAEIEKLLAENQ